MNVQASGRRLDPPRASTQLNCDRADRVVDIERCYACGPPCAAATPITGRAADPDRQVHTLVRLGFFRR